VTYDKMKGKCEVLEIFTLCYLKKTNANSKKSLMALMSDTVFSDVHQFNSKQKSDVSETITIFFMTLLTDVTDSQRRFVLLTLIRNRFKTKYSTVKVKVIIRVVSNKTKYKDRKFYSSTEHTYFKNEIFADVHYSC
jgi:hypothetical protein